MARDVACSSLDPATVLDLVRKPCLDLQQLSPATVGRFAPSSSSFWNRVDGVNDDVETDKEVGDGSS